MKLFSWLPNLLQLFFPRRCAICGEVLPEKVEGICLSCLLKLPLTNLKGEIGNKMERLFWGKFPIERASAYGFYRKGDSFCELIHHLKYHGRKDLGISLGRNMASELLPTGFFEDIDTIIPIPLHPRKEKMRGYNQSYYIALGIAEVTGLPIDNRSVIRNRFTETQTHKSADARWNNVDGIFSVAHPETYTNHHILLVDDVLTTGATITACADAFQQSKHLRISILTLGWAEY